MDMDFDVLPFITKQEDNIPEKGWWGVINSVTVAEEFEKCKKVFDVASLRSINQFLATNPYLPSLGFSDIALFLHCNQNRVDLTRAHIDRYVTMRSFMPEIFGNRDFSSQELQDISQNVCVIPCIERNDYGVKILYTRLLKKDAKKFVFKQFLKYLNMVLDLCIYEDGISGGYRFLFDLAGYTTEHVKKITPTLLRYWMKYMTTALPSDFKGIQFIDSSQTAVKQKGVEQFLKFMLSERGYGSMCSFLTKKSFSNLFPGKNRDILPTEMGGKTGSLQTLQLVVKEKLKISQEWLNSMDRIIKTREELRPGPRVTAGDVFGPREVIKSYEIENDENIVLETDESAPTSVQRPIVHGHEVTSDRRKRQADEDVGDETRTKIFRSDKEAAISNIIAYLEQDYIPGSSSFGLTTGLVPPTRDVNLVLDDLNFLFEKPQLPVKQSLASPSNNADQKVNILKHNNQQLNYPQSKCVPPPLSSHPMPLQNYNNQKHVNHVQNNFVVQNNTHLYSAPQAGVYSSHQQNYQEIVAGQILHARSIYPENRQQPSAMTHHNYSFQQPYNGFANPQQHVIAQSYIQQHPQPVVNGIHLPANVSVHAISPNSIHPSHHFLPPNFQQYHHHHHPVTSQLHPAYLAPYAQPSNIYQPKSSI